MSTLSTHLLDSTLESRLLPLYVYLGGWWRTDSLGMRERERALGGPNKDGGGGGGGGGRRAVNVMLGGAHARSHSRQLSLSRFLAGVGDVKGGLDPGGGGGSGAAVKASTSPRRKESSSPRKESSAIVDTLLPPPACSLVTAGGQG